MCPIYTHDSAMAKFSTNSNETDYSVGECEEGSGERAMYYHGQH